ncbi:MAG: AI-2E family transporter, partial [Clostridium sp.]|nr:AI-2E family transporter [Clostridium sp.]
LQSVLVSVGKALGNFTLGTISALPTFMLIVIFTMVCSYFFTKKLIINPNFIYNYFPTSTRQENRVKDIFDEGKNMILRYGFSYMLIIMIPGAISFTGYLILGVPHALVLAIIAAFLDLLPVLGVSATYLPLAIYFYAQGSVQIPIGLGIMYIIVVIGRNIWEPRILSSTMNINPVFTIMALFIGLKLAGFIGVLYLITLVVGFKILQTVHVLPTFNSTPNKKQIRKEKSNKKST